MSWPTYWILVLIMSIPSGMFIWWISGWWYKVRIKWSGAKQPDPFESRLTYIFSSFVYTAPTIALYFSTAFFFKNPWEAYSFESDNFYIAGVLFLAYTLPYLWSVLVSYKGVTTRFNLIKWKAKLWFIILPITTISFLGIIIYLSAQAMHA